METETDKALYWRDLAAGTRFLFRLEETCYKGMKNERDFDRIVVEDHMGNRAHVSLLNGSLFTDNYDDEKPVVVIAPPVGGRF